jgi:hypothetical protein
LAYRVGTTLALGRDNDDPARTDRAFIGVPGEDIGATVDGGIVQSTPIGSSTNIMVAGSPTPAVGYSGSAQTGTSYGEVIASPVGE